ncbi:polyketide synthase [Aspergillus tamarii]|uniref:Polyketide synthase n=1 Tax=Aspergillus tamarii TaxID=41984 RepID=A0A5N6V907_ASPTM|nr:polyketide synthase [Aspergillus tamarii]
MSASVTSSSLQSSGTNSPKSTSHPRTSSWPSPASSIKGPDPAVMVGYSCRVAGADRPSKLWDNINAQVDMRKEIPADRFNINNFYHPDGTHKGTTNCKYGYFLDQDIGMFDNSFFRISPKEAEAMDPQQRLLLEVVYEALEDARIPLEDIWGTRTSVFCGSFSNDYNAMTTKDLEYYPKYAVTGTGNAILANRISYLFNLQGPSVTIDTACSSSLVSFHLGAETIRDGESDVSIIVGSALHFDPNIFIMMTDLGMLSPEGRCRAFDARGQGYVRGEGICAVVLKRQSQAELNGDRIHAVVRASSVNHDGTKSGITLPSSTSQEALIRATYAKAGLDPAHTPYVEAHGTGTARGDPAEMRALQAVFSPAHRKDPLLVGSVKTNIGHTEGASGLAGVIKSAMALERGIIPPNMLFKYPNPEIKFEEWKVQVPTEATDFPSCPDGTRRASVNSFGYGGANAHVILEAYQPMPILTPPPVLPDAFLSVVKNRPFLIPLTSHTEKAGSIWADKLGSYVKEQPGNVADLACSLSSRRSIHAYRSFVVGKSRAAISEQLKDPAPWTKAAETPRPRLGFVFTGQGAQWFAMGRQLIQHSPLFRQTLQRCDRTLHALPDGPEWSIIEELSRTEEHSRLTETRLSQPICTALQLAIVDLLRSWGIEPTSAVGHSSGEIGSAYATGILSFDNALYAAYYRGLHMSSGGRGRASIDGAMLAVGRGPTELNKELKAYEGQISLAAVNSPSSVTLSGDALAIDALQSQLEEQRVFTRRLQVAQAFHSHHMYPLAPAYTEALKNCSGFNASDSKARMFSSVTGRLADPSRMGPEYWAANMTGCVRFWDALVGILMDEEEEQNVDILVEIGPHPALRGPSRQIMKSLGMDLPYLGSLARQTADFDALLTLAGQLFQHGYPVNLDAVNSDHFLVEPDIPCQAPNGKFLEDIPTYAWDHERYWAETRLIREHRLRPHRHTLLGAKLPGCVEQRPIWRNYLRIKDIAWLADHVIDGKILFPAAGYISMAIEAMCNVGDIGATPDSSVLLRNITISSPLVLDNSDMGTEVLVELHAPMTSAKSRSGTWYEFTIFSYQARQGCVEHCTGQVCFGDEPQESKAYDSVQQLLSKSTSSTPASTYYRHLTEFGLAYGIPFQLLSGLIESGPGFAVGTLTFEPSKYATQAADVTVAHPTLLDASFHTIFPALEATLQRPLDEASVPTFVRSVRVHPAMFVVKDSTDTQRVTTRTYTTPTGPRTATNDLLITSDMGQELLTFKGLQVTSLGKSSASESNRSVFFRTRWQPAFDSLPASSPALHQGDIAKLMDIYTHQHPDAKILHVTDSLDRTHEVLRYIGGGANQRRAFDTITPVGPDVLSVDDIETLESERPGRVVLGEVEPGKYDLVIVCQSGRDSSHWVKEHGYIIADGCHIDEPGLNLVVQGNGVEVWKKQQTNPVSRPGNYSVVLVMPERPSSRTLQIAAHIEGAIKSHSTQRLTLRDLAFQATIPAQDIIVLTSLDETVLDPAAQDPAQFEAIRTLFIQTELNIVWLLEGATQGPSKPLNGMLVGLTRVAKSENPDTRIVSFDIAPGQAASTIAAGVTHALDSGCGEDEFSLRDGVLYIPRIENDDSLNCKLSNGAGSGPKMETITSERPIRLTIGQVGLVDSLVWEDDPEVLDGELAPGDLEIEVWASALNFRDVAATMGIIDDYRLGDECAGVVLRTGKDVNPSDFKPGDRVVALRPGQGAHCSVVRHPAYHCSRLGEMPFDQAVSPCLILLTAYYSLIDVARLKKGESVLIHGAAGGVGQMAVQVAQLYGAKVIATVGSQVKRDLLRNRYGIPDEQILSSRDDSFVEGIMRLTEGRGVDVVLNSLSGKLLHASWNIVAPFGRFIEIGKRDIHENSALEMEPFRRNVLFASVDLVAVFAKNPALGARLSQECYQLVHNGKVQLPETILTLPWSKTIDGFRMLQMGKHIGKIVFERREGDLVPVRPSSLRNNNRFHSDKTYLLVGGLGGLGRALAEWLYTKGARSLAFLSRSGAARGEAQATVQWLQSHGVEVTVFRGDVTNYGDVETCVQGISNLGGIFQAAMVLQDAPLERMTLDQWQQCTRPKVVGTHNLHLATDGKELDFFVCFSSASACYGAKGQSNYSAANMYLDTLMRHRRESGLPGSTMNCGRISGVGVVAEDAALERFMDQQGYDPINKHELLSQIEEAVFSDQRTIISDRGIDTFQTITGISLKQKDRYWIGKPLFQNLYRNHDQSDDGTAQPGEVNLPSLLRQLPDDQKRAEALLERFIGRLVVVLGLSAENIDASNPLSLYGLDSLVGVELRNWFNKSVGVDIALFDVLGASSIKALIDQAVALFSTQAAATQASASADPTANITGSSSGLSNATSTQSKAGSSPVAAIPKVDPSVPLPLSAYQKRLWFTHCFAADKSVLNLAVLVDIAGQPNEQCMQQALHETKRRHPILRTRYYEGDEHAEQCMVKVSDTKIAFQDLSQAANPRDALSTLITNLQRKELDIEAGEVIDVTVAKLAASEFVMINIMHHIATDHACTRPMFAQFTALYNAIREERDLITVPLPTVTYADFTSWHHDHLTSASMSPHIQYWKETLADMPKCSKLLPFAKADRMQDDQYARANHTGSIDSKLLKRMKRICAQSGTSAFHFLLSAFRAFLYRYTEETDLTIVIFDGNRPHAEVSDTQGFFVNNIPIRCRGSLDGDFETLLKATASCTLEAMTHNAVPFDVIVTETKAPRSTNHFPIGQVSVNYRMPEEAGPFRTQDFVMRPNGLRNIPTPFDLQLDAQEGTDKQLELSLEFSTTLYAADDVARFFDNFLTFMTSLIRDYRQPIEEVPLCGPLERQRLESEFWNTGLNQDSWRDVSISSRVLERAQAHPDGIAIRTSEGNAVTYGELTTRARRVAFSLQAAGVSPGQFIGVLTHPGIDTVTAMLGILFNRCGYVPMDPTMPLDRLAFIAADSGINVVLFDPTSTELAAGLQSNMVGDLQAISIKESACTPFEASVQPQLPTDPCYMIYTSGSTGRPKGVVLCHESVSEMLAAMHDKFEFTTSDRFLQNVSPAFDLSVVQIFSALTAGARLCIASQRTRKDPIALGDFMRSESISVTYFTPSSLALVLEHNPDALRACSHYRISLCAGEWLPTRVARAFHDSGCPATLYNGWGPTETVVQTTFHQVTWPEDDHHNIPIGHAIGNNRHYVVDPAMNPLPPGFTGEICIGGPQVALGYRNRLEDNKKEFCSNPFALPSDHDKGWTRLCRTGDRGRFLPDGELQFVERISGDKQIKLRGYRIDLGEVEHVLHQASQTPQGQGLANLAVVARTIGENSSSLTDDRLLIAFVTTKQPVPLPEQGWYSWYLNSTSQGLLPEYMIPSAYVFLDALPITSNGKVDRKLLTQCDMNPTFPSNPAPAAADGGTGQVSREREHQDAMAAVIQTWKDILKVDRPILSTDNFFELGGQSILLMRVQSKLRRTFGVSLSLPEMIRTPTPSHIADLLTSHSQGSQQLNSSASAPVEDVSWEEECRLPNEEQYMIPLGCRRPLRSSITDILLTGSETFNGIHMLAHLLLQDSHTTIYVIGTHSPLTHSQLIASLHDHRLLHHTIAIEQVSSRVHCVPGSLSEAYLGLSHHSFQALARRVQSIYHLASEISLLKSYQSLKRINTTSALTLIALARSGGHCSEIHYLSTWSVPHLQSWNQAKRSLPEIDVGETAMGHFTPPPTNQSGYFQSRWVTEMLFTAASKRGFPITIYRSSAVTEAEHTRVPAPKDDLVRALLVDMLRHRAIPKTNANTNPFVIDFIPVDYLVQALGHISRSEEGGRASGLQVYHLVNPSPLPLDELPRVMGKISGDGITGRKVDLDQWLEIVGKGANEQEQLRLETMKSYFELGHTMFQLTRTNTDAVLKRDQFIECPAVNENYLSHLWKTDSIRSVMPLN